MWIAICDDNKNYLNTVEEYLEKMAYPKLDYDLFKCGEDLVRRYENGKTDYDAVFLDMEMEGLDGIATANMIRNSDKYVIIVFITSHKNYMQKSFECSPFRFLVKPIGFEDFKHVFDDVCLKIQEERATLVFTENWKTMRIYCDNIIFFENDSHWVWIQTKEKRYKISKSFSALYNQLNQVMFIQIHRGFIVNLKYIKEISERDILLYDYERPIPLSRKYKHALTESFFQYKERKYLI